jgi:hypothetical protein
VNRARVFIAAAIAVLCLVLAVGGSYALSLAALARSQQQLCGVFTLLTTHPVPKPADPAANPSREQSYVFYTELLSVERAYKC